MFHRRPPLEVISETLEKSLESAYGAGDEYLQLPSLWRKMIIDECRRSMETAISENNGFDQLNEIPEAAATAAIETLSNDCFLSQYFWPDEDCEKFRKTLVCEFARDLNGGAFE